ncbi:MAG: amino acid ABC transporter substrate-binding protein [Burkholderiales bacterium]|nr:MAG: amino acid ABC transporter substrate-binding protein [Betaproteobacteria bacterium]TAG24778.1 MAG: amino acid ABC transporter substrate-binding protein [Burkholderiales bacterium]
MKKSFTRLAALSAAALVSTATMAQAIKVAQIVELSGGGTTAGTMYRNGVKLALAEINAAGGIMGRQVAISEMDTQSQPAIAKAMTVKAIDEGVTAIFGPVFSGSILVSQADSQKAGIPNFTGGEASNVTAQGNPFIFRSSFNQSMGMPKVANYLANDLKAKSVAVIFINNDFGKGGRDAILKELGARGVKVAADISTDPGQIDFSSAVLRAKQANADALFAYLNEEESARLLRELRKQGYDKPLVGETTLMGAKVIELAGAAANGVRGHVGLTVDAPTASIREFAGKFEKEYKSKSDHNGLKGYFSAYMLKAAIEKAKSTEGKAIAAAMKNSCFTAKQHPGLLLDVCYDDKGDIDRESFLVEVKSGKQEVVATLPMLNKR